MSAEIIGYTETRVSEGPELQAAMWCSWIQTLDLWKTSKLS